MIIFFDPFIIFLILFYIIVGSIGLLADMASGFLVGMSIVLALINIIICVRFVIVEKSKLLIGKLKQIFLGIFFVFFPILLFALFFISGKYIDINNFHWLGRTLVVVYQKPKVFLISAIVGGGINIILIGISCLADYFEEKKKKQFAVAINCILILLIVLIPYGGKLKSYENRIEYCKKHNSKKCVVQKDDKIIAAFKMNYKGGTIDLSDPIELKFLNCRVKKGEILYKTSNEYSKKDVNYVEVYNDSVWGYIEESNIK